MANDFLKEIVAYKRSLLERKKVFFDSLKKKIKDDKLSRYHIFKNAISRKGAVNLIAEIKKASPSQGVICQDFDVYKLARIYRDNGAAAISVLTEDKFFLGKPAYLKNVADAVNLPTLLKDFIIDEVQIYEGFYHGANAILLIVAILDEEALRHLIKVATDLDLDCLVEVHNETELKTAVNAGAEIIGINNRDLRTFEVDFKTSKKLAPLIPKDRIIVVESGIKSHEEFKALQNLGVHAVLIGETFLRAPDVGKKIREVMTGK